MTGRDAGPRRRVELDAEAALAAGDLRRAAAIVERAKGSELGDERAGMLALIHTLTPAILWPVSPDAMPTLRRLAALSLLWGEDGPAHRAVPDGFWTGIHLDPVTAARMLIFAAYHRVRLETWRELDRPGRRQYRVDPIDDPDHCAACRALAARPPVLRLEDIPELPHPGCTSPMGCRCAVRRERR